MLIDTHCHLDFPELLNDLPNIFSKCSSLSINYFVVPSTTKQHFDGIIALSKQYKQIIPVLGLHPYFINEHSKTDLDSLEQHCQLKLISAIGETGLDFFLPELKTNQVKEQQILYFTEHVRLARKYDLPLIIHARKSHELILQILKKIKPRKGGIIHAFNGSPEQVKEYLKLDFNFGFGGTMSYTKATKVRSLAANLPIQSIVLETDSPDMIPAFSIDKRNSPENLRQLFEILSDLRSETPEFIENQLKINCQSLFPQIV